MAGNPARIAGYADTIKSPVEKLPKEPFAVKHLTDVPGVTLIQLPRITDIRGSLTAGEIRDIFPFEVERYFMVCDVPSAETRGEHAHKVCHQFLICAHGRCSVVADDGTHRQEFQLDRPELGLYLPPMVWGIQYKYSADAVLLVFASHRYATDDYIRDYNEFLHLKGLK